MSDSTKNTEAIDSASDFAEASTLVNTDSKAVVGGSENSKRRTAPFRVGYERPAAWTSEEVANMHAIMSTGGNVYDVHIVTGKSVQAVRVKWLRERKKLEASKQQQQSAENAA